MDKIRLESSHLAPKVRKGGLAVGSPIHFSGHGSACPLSFYEVGSAAAEADGEPMGKASFTSSSHWAGFPLWVHSQQLRPGDLSEVPSSLRRSRTVKPPTFHLTPNWLVRIDFRRTVSFLHDAPGCHMLREERQMTLSWGNIPVGSPGYTSPQETLRNPQDDGCLCNQSQNLARGDQLKWRRKPLRDYV